jgi:hypothetical protein
VADAGLDESPTERRPRLAGLRPPPGWLAAALPLLPTLVGVAVWWAVLRTARLDAMTDMGLVSVVPVAGLVALALPTVGFCWSLGQRSPRAAVLLCHVVALIFALHAVPVLVESVPGLRVAWRHVGVVGQIAATGQVDPRIDAYFNWPGFFSVLASLTQAAGVSPLSLTRLAPLAFHLAYLPALLLLLRGAGADRRLTWLAVWVFELANWVSQDYLAPQAEAYLLYLVVLAILVGWFTRTPSRRLAIEPPPTPDPLSRWARPGLLAVVVVLFAVLVASHQLTPFALLVGMLALVAWRRLEPRRLPLLLALMLAAWLAFPAAEYVSGHFDKVTGTLGGVSLDERITGSPGHLFVVRLRLAATIALGAVAVAGWWRRRRRGRDDVTLGLLGAAPPLLALIQPYGGEILMRVYLFALPVLAFFAAAALLPRRWDHRSRMARASLVLVLVAMTGLFLFTRYGNQRVDRFTPADVAAVDSLYARAEPGSLFLVGSQNLPWKGEGYAAYRYQTLDRLRPPVPDAGAAATAALAALRAHPGPGAFYVVTPSVYDDQAVTGSLPDGTLERIQAALETAPDFVLAYADGTALIYARTTPPPASGGAAPGAK